MKCPFHFTLFLADVPLWLQISFSPACVLTLPSTPPWQALFHLSSASCSPSQASCSFCPLMTPAVIHASHLPSLDVPALYQQWHNTPSSFLPILASPSQSCWTWPSDAPFSLNPSVMLRAPRNAVLADLLITQLPQKPCKTVAEGSSLKAEQQVKSK